MTVRLAPAATVVLRETLALGRTGERGGRLTSETAVTDDIGPILRETLEIEGAVPVPGVLGEERVIDSILALGDGVDVPDIPGAVRLELDRGGAVLRHLGRAAHESPLHHVNGRKAACTDRQPQPAAS